MDRANGLEKPFRGIMFMIIGAALLTANDSLLKWLTSGYPIGQIIFQRGLFVLIPISILVWRAGSLSVLIMQNYREHLLRSSLMIVGTFLFVTGLRFLPIADAIAIAFAGPLFITVLATPMLGETVGWRRWLGVCIGFLGVLIICKPGGEVFQWASLFPLTASLAGAFRDILTRKMSVSETSESLLFYSTVAILLSGLGSFPFVEWHPVATGDWLLFLFTGILVGGAHFLMIEAFRNCEAALVAPFKYTSVIWAFVFGYLFFGDIPEITTLFGGFIVILSGIYILQREKILRKRGSELT